MKNKITILYIGNKLSHHGYTKGLIETLGPQLEELNFSVIYGGNKYNPISRLLQMITKIFVNRGNVDYVIIDTYSTTAFWYAWICAMFCRIFNICYIPILHGGDMPIRLQKSRLFCNSIFKYSYKNIAVSNYLKNIFNKYGFSSILIPNSINISNYAYKKRANINPKILWVRSFHKQYNPKMAIDIIFNLKKKYENVTLCMVGPDKDGSMKDVIKYSKELGVYNQLEITGVLKKSEWLKLSQRFDVFINTTNVDNTPVSVIEAMALGLPVVSTNVGGIPFLVESGVDGLLVESNDIDSMVSKIKMLLDDYSLVQNLTTSARKKASSMDWNSIKNEWIKILS